MSVVEHAYNDWASTYDDVVNPTRDLDSKALQSILAPHHFENVLELGCGTGKNTVWFGSKASQVTAVDISEEMLAVAKKKITADHVNFIKADINKAFEFTTARFDLVSCNLVLEHVQELVPLFEKVSACLQSNGLFFICELHPIKQYLGSKARFEKNKEMIVLDCYTHHLSDYLGAKDQGFELLDIHEWFDEGTREIPRLISFLFRKK
jgi:ubiquinone/menaquinone biosynthesis C-methylase UbiE